MNNIYLKIVNCIIKIEFKPYYLEFAQKELFERINKLYKPFIILQPQAQKFDLTIVFQHSHRFKNKIIKRTGEEYVFVSQRINQKTIYAVYTMSIYQFQNLLYKSIIQLLQKKDVLILHASASLIRNKAYVFLGKSGGGKSTIIKLLKEKHPALADDSVFIYQDGGKFFLTQTPFYEKEWWIKKTNKSYSLGGIFFLKKSQNFELVKEQDHKTIYSYLLKQAVWNEMINKKYLKLAINLILKYNNFYYLNFAKDADKLNKLLIDI